MFPDTRQGCARASCLRASQQSGQSERTFAIFVGKVAVQGPDGSIVPPMRCPNISMLTLDLSVLTLL